LFTKENIKSGWVEIEGVSSTEYMLEIAASLGSIRPHPNGEKLSILTPSYGEHSIKGTFSNRYGFSSFPLHTDTAFWSEPSRYIVIGMFMKSDSNTYLIQTSDVFSKLSTKALNYAKSATYVIDTIEGKKYTSLLFSQFSENGLRFDPCCMKPINKAAKYFHNEFCGLLENIKVNSIEWTGNKAVVIDNWKCLHGRSAIAEDEHSRELMRIYTG